MVNSPFVFPAWLRFLHAGKSQLRLQSRSYLSLEFRNNPSPNHILQFLTFYCSNRLLRTSQRWHFFNWRTLKTKYGFPLSLFIWLDPARNLIRVPVIILEFFLMLSLNILVNMWRLRPMPSWAVTNCRCFSFTVKRLPHDGMENFNYPQLKTFGQKTLSF